MTAPAKGRTVITIVGGGASTPRLCDALASAVHLPEVELRLTARDPGRLRIIAEHCAARVRCLRPDWSLSASTTPAAAFEGASVIITLARIGGLEARMWDEMFPRRFGLVGDEGLGPGGIANAWRTVPELSGMARQIRGVAPNARVVNLMAPLGITTRLLLEYGLDAVGVCELPLVTIEAWLAQEGGALESTHWSYAGLNHIGWFWNRPSITGGGCDGGRKLPRAADGPNPMDRPTVERYGAAPLRYFYEVYDRPAAERLGLSRRPRRASELISLSEALVEQYAVAPGVDAPLAEVRPTPWFERATAPIVAAMLGGPAHSGFANVRNGDLVPELPCEQVVEVAAKITGDGTATVNPGPLPSAVARFLQHASHSETLTFWAASHRDSTMLEKAIQALPLPIAKESIPKLARLARRSPWSTAARGIGRGHAGSPS